MKNSFQCKDGWLQEMTLNFDKDFNNFLRAIGREDLVGDSRWTCMEDTQGDKADELTKIFDEALAKMTLDEAIAAFNKYDIAVGPYYTGLWTTTDAQAEANNYFATITERTGKEIKIPRFPLQFGETPEFSAQYYSSLGGDTRDVMRQYGYTDAEIDDMIANGAVNGK